jgi:hypothetical protein
MIALPRVPRDAFVVIRTDGSEETHPFPAKRGGARLNALKAALGCDTLDMVTLTMRSGGPDLVMAVNDLGYETRAVERGPGHIELVPVRARLPVNQRATALYHATCKPGTTHEIVGDVAIMHDDD